MAGHAYSAAAAPPRRLARIPGASGPAAPLALAALCALAMVLVWSIAELIPAVQMRDAIALRDFTLIGRPRVDQLAGFLVHLLDPQVFVLWGIALVAAALARGRPRLAVGVVVLMGLAPYTAETLKPLLAHPHLSVETIKIGDASWPSGHATAALALGLAAALVAPARLRPLVVAAAVVFALAVGVSLLILAWHMPSDVLGGYLVATAWAALVVAALRLAERRWPTHARRAEPGAVRPTI